MILFKNNLRVGRLAQYLQAFKIIMSDFVSQEKVDRNGDVLAGYGVATLIAAVGGTLASSVYKGEGSWYESISKSSITPPKYLFPVIWTILYILMFIAGYLGDVAVRSLPPSPERNALLSKVRGLYAFQLILNFLWCVAFFQLQSPGLAFAINIGLVATILLWILTIRDIPGATGAQSFMIPNLLWTSFALILTGIIFVKSKM